MLPSLQRLSLHSPDEDDTGARTKAAVVRAAAKQKKPEGAIRKRRGGAARPAEDAESAEAKEAERIEMYGEDYREAKVRYPGFERLQEIFQLKSRRVFPDNFWFSKDEESNALRYQLLLSTLLIDDRWFFSCHPNWSGGATRGARFPVAGSATDITLAITKAFAWKQPDSSLSCGTSNCFVEDLELNIEDLSRAATAVNRAIYLFAPAVGDMPERVSVRSPRLRPRATEKLVKHLYSAYTELFLTSFMSKHDLSPPLYLALPVHPLDDVEDPTNVGFIYVTEAGWTELHNALHEATSTELESIGTSVVECLEKTAQKTILLYDIKTRNMVAKKTGNSFEVRMIDFDAVFTTNANSEDLPTTTADCVFFVNSLLLLNSSLRGLRTTATGPLQRKGVFTKLAKEVIVRWRYMKRAGTVGAICAAFERDRSYGEGLRRDRNGHAYSESKNLSLLHPGDFLAALRALFYHVLSYYGVDDILQRDEVPLPGDAGGGGDTQLDEVDGADFDSDGDVPQDLSEAGSPEYYIDRLLSRIQTNFKITDADIEKMLGERLRDVDMDDARTPTSSSLRCSSAAHFHCRRAKNSH